MQLELVVAHTQVTDCIELVLRVQAFEDVRGPIEGMAYFLQDLVDPSKFAHAAGFGLFTMSVLLDKEAAAAPISLVL